MLKRVSLLGVGFKTPGCGKGKHDPGWHEQVAADEKKAEIQVANMVVKVCKKLEVLWIEDCVRVSVRRDVEGKITEMSWDRSARRVLLNEQEL